MSATHFTIYKLKDDVDWNYIIEEFNSDKDEDKQYDVRTNNSEINFSNITNYALYTREATSVPEWGSVMNRLVTDLPPISNVSNSYVLFIKVNESQFAVTGGNGYQVISRDKEFNFGIDLLSRLIERNEAVVKRAKERFLTGSILGGDYQLKGKGTLSYAENRENLEFIIELINIDTLKSMQLLGFNYNAALGEPLTIACSNFKKNKLSVED